MNELSYNFDPPSRFELETIYHGLGRTLISNLQYKFQARIPHSGLGQRLSENFQIQTIIGDGNCFFRSISCALTGDQSLYHIDLRHRLVLYEQEYCDLVEPHLWTGEKFDTHVRQLERLNTDATDTDIVCCASMLNVNIFVYSQVPARSGHWSWLHYTPSMLFPTDEGAEAVSNIYLVNTNSDHFDLVYAMGEETRVQQRCTKVEVTRDGSRSISGDVSQNSQVSKLPGASRSRKRDRMYKNSKKASETSVHEGREVR